MCAVALRIGVHIRYQFALSLTIDGRKNKASNPFSLFDDFACLFRYFSVPFISLSPSRSSHFALYFSVFVFIVVKRDGSSWHNEKKNRKKSNRFHCCVVLLLRFVFSHSLSLFLSVTVLQCSGSELKMIALGIVYPFWMSSSSPTSPFEYWFGWAAVSLFVFIPFFFPRWFSHSVAKPSVGD